MRRSVSFVLHLETHLEQVPTTNLDVMALGNSRKAPAPIARARVIPLDFKQQAGEELWPGCYIGKLLGAGSQAKVYTLVDAEGKPLNRVLKIGHTDVAHTMFLNKFAASMMVRSVDALVCCRFLAIKWKLTGNSLETDLKLT